MGVLEGKAVVITGSGGGIGAACAIGCARQGAAVVVNDVDATGAESTAAAIRAAGGRAAVCIADASDWDEAERLIATCIEVFGRIDGLVNNAAIVHYVGIHEIEPQKTRTLVETNVLGPLYCTAHAVKPMLAQGSGSIVNVTSAAHMGVAKAGTYAASKGAVASMVYSWALELEGTGVRVNAISPVARGTRMTGDAPNLQPPEANSPLVEFLLSDLSSQLNGQIIRIDKQELQLYVHPAVLVPSALNAQWSAEAIAAAFEGEFRDKLMPCGVMGAEGVPAPLQSGFWSRQPAM